MKQNRDDFLAEVMDAGCLSSDGLILNREDFDAPIDTKRPLAWIEIGGIRFPVIRLKVRAIIELPSYALNDKQFVLEIGHFYPPMAIIVFVVPNRVRKTIKKLDILSRTVFEFLITSVGFNLEMSGHALIQDIRAGNEGKGTEISAHVIKRINFTLKPLTFAP